MKTFICIMTVILALGFAVLAGSLHGTIIAVNELSDNAAKFDQSLDEQDAAVRSLEQAVRELEEAVAAR